MKKLFSLLILVSLVSASYSQKDSLQNKKDTTFVPVIILEKQDTIKNIVLVYLDSVSNNLKYTSGNQIFKTYVTQDNKVLKLENMDDGQYWINKPKSKEYVKFSLPVLNIYNTTSTYVSPRLLEYFKNKNNQETNSNPSTQKDLKSPKVKN